MITGGINKDNQSIEVISFRFCYFTKRKNHAFADTKIVEILLSV